MILSINEIKKYLSNGLDFPKVLFDDETLSKLRRINLVYFLKWFDPDNLCYDKGSFRLVDNKSICLNYCWCKNMKTGDSCSSIDFLQKHYNYNFYKSCYILYCFLRSGFSENKLSNLTEKSITQEDIINSFRNGELKPIDGVKNIFANMVYTRGFDSYFLEHLKENNYIFCEDNGGKLKNIVFPHFDGQATSICDIVGYDVYGTLSNDNKSFKRCSTSKAFSNYSIYSDNYDNTGANGKVSVFVFDSDIELLSFYYLYYNNFIDIETDNFVLVSLRGRHLDILKNYVNLSSVSYIIYNCVLDDDFQQHLKDYFNDFSIDDIKVKTFENYDYMFQVGFKHLNDILINKHNLSEEFKEKLYYCLA